MPRSHAALPRLFVEDDLASEAALLLNDDRAHYLANVLRLRVGAQVVVFNGRDGAWLAQLTEPRRKAVGLDLVEPIAAQTPPSELWYGFAPLKSARLDYVVQKATEMGAGIIQPVVTRYTQARLKADRLLANAIEAAEQCEVLSIPQIAAEIALPRLIDAWPATHGDRVLLFADEGEASSSPVQALSGLSGGRIGLLVGPEGGFSDDERALLRAQPFVKPISLGPRILRADTAAVAGLAVIQAIIGDWR
jgi:16S rRNA (uracil1498-N3)-methyltransferase